MFFLGNVHNGTILMVNVMYYEFCLTLVNLKIFPLFKKGGFSPNTHFHVAINAHKEALGLFRRVFTERTNSSNWTVSAPSFSVGEFRTLH